MARMMDEADELYRAVVLRKRMVHNPEYDYRLGYNQRDTQGALIPSQIPSETETFRTIYGPYTSKGPATIAKNKNSYDGWGGPVVGGHVEKAVVTWERVDG